MKYIRFSIWIVALIFIISNCTSSQTSQKETKVDSALIVKDTFMLPDIPKEITIAEERMKYLALHYWERFDFADEKLIQKPQITEQAFVDYINILNYLDEADAYASIDKTLQQSGASEKMYAHFASLLDKYYNGPNSPFFNAKYYKEALKYITKSKLMTDLERSRYNFQLKMMNKNNVGEKAANFSFTLADGSTKKLHDLKSDYIILMFTDPDCGNCNATVNKMKESAELANAMKRNSYYKQMLIVVNIYPGNDYELWKSHLDFYPKEWITGYDKNLQIPNNQLYNIQAFPTFYLLDKDKKVILKDSSQPEIEMFFSTH